MDIIPIANSGANNQPIRIYSTTVLTWVNWGAPLPVGADSSSREKIRYLAGYIFSQQPNINIDPGTQAFLQPNNPAPAFLNMSQFAKYDAYFG